jgi:hypothetical protein
MAPDTTDPGIERLRAVAATSNLRSPLGRWFSAHHAEFEKLLHDYRPRWEALIEQFASDGLLSLPPEFNSDDKKVRTVTRRRVVKSTMRTWERVKAQIAKKPMPVESTPKQQVQAVARPAQQQTTPPKPTNTDDIRAMLSPGRKLPDPL